jgi:hypothetical protein
MEVTIFAFVSFSVVGRTFVSSNVFIASIPLLFPSDVLHACHISSFQVERELVKAIAYICALGKRIGL